MYALSGAHGLGVEVMGFENARPLDFGEVELGMAMGYDGYDGYEGYEGYEHKE